jgi:hypothetical protein
MFSQIFIFTQIWILFLPTFGPQTSLGLPTCICFEICKKIFDKILRIKSILWIDSSPLIKTKTNALPLVHAEIEIFDFKSSLREMSAPLGEICSALVSSPHRQCDPKFRKNCPMRSGLKCPKLQNTNIFSPQGIPYQSIETILAFLKLKKKLLNHQYFAERNCTKH